MEGKWTLAGTAWQFGGQGYFHHTTSDLRSGGLRLTLRLIRRQSSAREALEGRRTRPHKSRKTERGCAGVQRGVAIFQTGSGSPKILMKLCGSVRKFGQPTTRHMAHESSCVLFHLCGEVCSTVTMPSHSIIQKQQRFLHFYNFISQKGWESWFPVTFFLFLFSKWIWSFQTTAFNELHPHWVTFNHVPEAAVGMHDSHHLVTEQKLCLQC